MTGNNTVMTAAALAAALLAGLAIFRGLRAARRRATVHADLPAPARPPALTLAKVAPVLPSAPLAATVLYTDAKGQSSVREVVIHSRKQQGEGRSALNVHEGDNPAPKIYLIERISRLDYTVEGEQYSLSSSEQIRELLERVIPFKGERPARPARPAPQTEPRGSEETAASSAAPAPPAAPVPLASLLPSGARGFAVIDLETTGFGAEHRILEIAVIRLEPDGRVKDVWDTLVHPGISIPLRQGPGQTSRPRRDGGERPRLRGGGGHPHPARPGADLKNPRKPLPHWAARDLGTGEAG